MAPGGPGFVTYERKPYPLLAPSAFDITFTHEPWSASKLRAEMAVE